MPERCDHCRFFHPNPPASGPEVITFSADGVRGGGECRCQPPIWREHEMAHFPLVAADWWCGEFACKPTEP